jgi:hypothetical protein
MAIAVGKNLRLGIGGTDLAGDTEFTYEISQDVQELEPTKDSFPLPAAVLPGMVKRKISGNGLISLTDAGFIALEGAAAGDVELTLTYTIMGGAKTAKGRVTQFSMKAGALGGVTASYSINVYDEA